ncbi:MAG TPA: 16S rRNA (cytosine(1402)-N(4))-methyltransferase RsmH [Woeseiaceae bacterium]
MNKSEGSAESHVPVLLDAVLEGLNIQPHGYYIDGTFGRGGHSREILKRLDSAGRLLAIDRDPDAIAAARPLSQLEPRFEIVKGEISDIRQIALERNLLGKVDGLLFDLGVSSPQLADAARGFSFQFDGPLDMRMDPTEGVSAADWLAAVDERTLKRVIAQFGEERSAGRYAKAIIAARAVEPIRRTIDLAKIIEDAAPKGPRRKHPATKTFQAIRIQVNDELGQIRSALEACIDLLRKGGRLCVISFHSLEDRIVKRFMRQASREAEAWRGMPTMPQSARPPLRAIGKAVAASDVEVAANVRSRSARLRIAERI